jgi:hypothetical protein
MTDKEKEIVFFILDHDCDDKQWVLDQVLRIILEKQEYTEIIRKFEDPDSAGNSRYPWNLGIAP